MPAAPRICCVDGHNVQVACQAQMLKAVVKYKRFAAQVLDCPCAGADSIRICNHCSAADEISGEEIRFVAGLPFVRQEFTSV